MIKSLFAQPLGDFLQTKLPPEDGTKNIEVYDLYEKNI
jgi:hypothetical protein